MISGELEVRHGDTVVATVGPGDCIGEAAVLTHGRRNATVVARTKAQLGVIDLGALQGLLGEIPDLAVRITAIRVSGVPNSTADGREPDAAPRRCQTASILRVEFQECHRARRPDTRREHRARVRRRRAHTDRLRAHTGSRGSTDRLRAHTGRRRRGPADRLLGRLDLGCRGAGGRDRPRRRRTYFVGRSSVDEGPTSLADAAHQTAKGDLPVGDLSLNDITGALGKGASGILGGKSGTGNGLVDGVLKQLGKDLQNKLENGLQNGFGSGSSSGSSTTPATSAFLGVSTTDAPGGAGATVTAVKAGSTRPPTRASSRVTSSPRSTAKPSSAGGRARQAGGSAQRRRRRDRHLLTQRHARRCPGSARELQLARCQHADHHDRADHLSRHRRGPVPHVTVVQDWARIRRFHLHRVEGAKDAAISANGVLVVLTAVAIAGVAGQGSAGAVASITVDFETFAPAPATLPGTPGAVTTSGVTVSGGTLLQATPLLPGNPSVVYGTCAPQLSVVCAGFSATLTVDLGAPAQSVTVSVFNGQDVPVAYTVTDNLGGTQTKTLRAQLPRRHRHPHRHGRRDLTGRDHVRPHRDQRLALLRRRPGRHAAGGWRHAPPPDPGPNAPQAKSATA